MLGVLKAGSLLLYTLEDRWCDNQHGVSCIPDGAYRCIPHGWEANSPVRMKRTWEITNVPGRSAILVHAGNRDTDTEGCVLVGMGVYNGVLTSSVTAMEELRELIGANPFTLTIKTADDISLAA